MKRLLPFSVSYLIFLSGELCIFQDENMQISNRNGGRTKKLRKTVFHKLSSHHRAGVREIFTVMEVTSNMFPWGMPDVRN